MNQRKTLITATLGEVVLLVGVLAGYLIAIARRLRSVSSTLGSVTFGVRAIEKQTAPIAPLLGDINGALEGVAAALQDVVGAEAEDTTSTTSPGSGDDAGTMETASDLPKPTT